jgi:hypothetical protein
MKFCIRYALECKVGGLVMLLYNKINKELSNLASKALAPSTAHIEPMIHNRCTAEEAKTKGSAKPAVQ